MRLFLDTESNGFGGELISMALVSESGDEWYEVVSFDGLPEPFVAKHVLSNLGKEPITNAEFVDSLDAFLTGYSLSSGLEIIADWTSDFEHLSSWLSSMGAYRGWSIPFECTMRLVRGDATIAPENPHNALSDARALRDWWKRQQPFGHPAEDQWISSGQRRI